MGFKIRSVADFTFFSPDDLQINEGDRMKSKGRDKSKLTLVQIVEISHESLEG